MEEVSYWKSLPTTLKIKYISIVVLAVLFTIFIAQNLEKVELDVLFWTFNVRFAFALIFCFLIGVLISYIWLKMKFSKKEKITALKNKKAEDKAPAITEEK